MKNQYQILKDRQHKEFNAFPLGAAFSQTQFTEMMAKWGLEPTDTDKILHVGAGCYIRKTDREAFHALVERLEKKSKMLLPLIPPAKALLKICSYTSLQITNIASHTTLKIPLTLFALRSMKSMRIKGFFAAWKRRFRNI